MAPEKAPAFQFYPKDFLMDGNVAGMSLAERGAYITLLSLCWIDQSLPTSHTQLARMVGLSVPAFLKVWPSLRPCFREAAEDTTRLIHPRLEKEREKQETYRRRQSDAGKASAARRQPQLNHGSTEAQPEGNSPVSCLQTPVKEPPVVPLEGGREPTRKERKDAEGILSKRFGRCHHSPDCADREACVLAIVIEMRTKKGAA